MENLRCAEFLTESPSTSSASGKFGGTSTTTLTTASSTGTTGNGGGSGIISTASAPIILSGHHHQQPKQPLPRQAQQQHRRRAAKSDIGLRQSSYSDSKLVLGQIPVNRKRQSTADRLNTAQWPSVIPLADKTVHRDIRCLRSMFNAQAILFLNRGCFTTVQMDVTPHHRQQAVEWLCDVCKEEHCEPDVFLLAVSFLDRFLSVQHIDRYNLQALAGVCLLISSKVKAPQPLNAQRVAYYTDGAVRVDQILHWELLVLSKLNWDVSTSTALDFLDQVAARFSTLHPLSENCRLAAHRIQLDEKFSFLVPSVQAAICLLFAANCYGYSNIIECAEKAIVTVLRSDPKVLQPYLHSVQCLVMGPKSDCEGPQNSPPSGLVAPPTSEERKTPQLPVAEAAVSPDTATSKAMFLACSCRSTPETSHLISDDSGFISGISSPATALNTSTRSRGSGSGGFLSSSKRRTRRSANLSSNISRRSSYECFDSGVIAYYHASEDDFLSSF